MEDAAPTIRDGGGCRKTDGGDVPKGFTAATILILRSVNTGLTDYDIHRFDL